MKTIFHTLSNEYTIEKYFLGKDERLESICRNNLNEIVSNLSKERTDFGFQNYNMSTWNLFQEYADDFEELTTTLSKISKSYMKNYFDKELNGNFFVSELWGIVTEPDGLATPHNHWPALFTFVYYLSLPKNNPPLVFTDSNLEIQPKEGELIFFPSWIKHEVPKNKTDGERVCYAGNIYYEEKMKEIGGRTEGLEPTRYDDWEMKGRCIDF